MNELSAAEKAELRRQKILAKKKARMAYVVEGDRSQLPSSVPADASSFMATTTGDTVHSSKSSTAPSTELNGTKHDVLAPSTLNRTPLSVPEVPAFKIEPSNTNINHITPERTRATDLVRILTLVIAAFVVGASSLYGGFSGNPLSAVEAYACVRGLIILMSRRNNRHRSMQMQSFTNFGLLDVATRIPGFYTSLRDLFREFALFWSVTLLTISLLRNEDL